MKSPDFEAWLEATLAGKTKPKLKAEAADVLQALGNLQRRLRIMEARFVNLEAMDERLSRRIQTLDDDFGEVLGCMSDEIDQLKGKQKC